VPYTGRLVASAEVRDLDAADPSVLVSAGLQVSWGSIGVGGGALYGEGFEQSPGWYAEARLEGANRPGLPTGRYVLDIPVRSGVGARGIIALVLRLEQALHDADVAGVYLRLRDTGIGSAYAEELRQVIGRLTEAGKPVVCHLTDGGGGDYYACAAGTATYVDVAGGIRLAGTSGTTMYYGGILHDWGIRSDFLRIGPQKGAAEQFSAAGSSGPVQAQRARFYDDVHTRIVADLADDLERSREEIDAVLDEGPYQTYEALAARLIAGAADEHEMQDRLAEAFGGHPSLRSAPPARVSPRWRQRYVGVVVVDGDIVDGDNLDIPIIGITQSGGRTVVEAIEGLAADPWCSAIVLRVDSGGGSALASDQIYRAVVRARTRKPVIASLGAIAASGGYYVVSAAEEIWAEPATLTGSIGVYFGKVDFAPIAERFNVGLESIQTGRHAGMTSLYRPFTPDERRVLADKVRIWYRLFLQRVAEGRGMPVGDVDRIARGRVWSGDAARRLGLIDRLGGFGSALERARQAGELSHDAPVVVVPWRPSSLLDYVVGPIFAGASASDMPAAGFEAIDAGAVGVLTPELFDALSFVFSAAGTTDGVPQARIDQRISLP
jgi:protease-4